MFFDVSIDTAGWLLSAFAITVAVSYSFNLGISLGAFLGGLVSAYYGVYYILWVSILLLTVTFILRFLTFPKKIIENEKTSPLKHAASIPLW